jgi:hypothetical protein
MTAQTIKVSCPKCGTSVDLSQAVQEELVRDIQEQTRRVVDAEKSLELKNLQGQLKEKNELLQQARDLELELRQKSEDLEERTQNLDLEIARRLDEERQQIARKSREKTEEEFRLKLAENETKMNSLREQLESAQRKLEQGSMQLQGESAELDMEKLLKAAFIFDEIAPVEKGIKGADILQRVKTRDGQLCGIIVWEIKNTKNWNDRWISKLKEDQLAAKADLAVLVSAVLPEDVPHFSNVENIWVSGFPYALSLGLALREHLVQVARARRSLEGKDEKIEIVYRYLSGIEFRQRIELMVKTYQEMKTDLDKERTAMTKIWNQREKNLDRVMLNVAGMYGDLQGIIGAALPNIQALELPEPRQ